MMTPKRGEIWRIRFDPAEGDEIKRTRTAVVMSADTIGRLRLKIVVPITAWAPAFARHSWFVRLIPTPGNGLTKESAADTFQVKSVSETRFVNKLGQLTVSEMDDISRAIALCVAVP
jgi:mRNA interferase MazF